jgi:hypothetical protein
VTRFIARTQRSERWGVILSIDAAGATFAQGALSNTAPWNIRPDQEASVQIGWIFDQLSPVAESITAGSSYSDLGGGMFFDCMIGSFELSKGKRGKPGRGETV